jgi:hypothetical protein
VSLEPDQYAGWKVISFSDDGSVLIESQIGQIRRVQLIGTVEMQKEIKELKKKLDDLKSKLKKTKDGVAVVPNSDTPLWYIHPNSKKVYERSYQAYLDDAHSHWVYGKDGEKDEVVWISVSDCYYFREEAVKALEKETSHE